MQISKDKTTVLAIPYWYQCSLLLYFCLSFIRDFRESYPSLWFFSNGLLVLIGCCYFFRYYYITPNLYIKWKVVFIVWCGLSILWSIDSSTSIDNFFWGILPFYLICMSLCYVIKNREDLYRVMLIYHISILITVIYTLLAVDITTIILGERMGADVDGNTTMNANDTAMMCVSGIFISLYFLYNSLRNLSNIPWVIFFLACIFIFVGIIMLSGSRRAFITLFFSFILFLLLRKGIFVSKVIQIILLLILTLVSFQLLMKNEIFSVIIGSRIMDASEGIFGSGTSEGSFNYHKEMIDYGWGYFYNSPIIGHGLMAFSKLYQRQSGLYLFSHNNYTELLVNLGIVGFSIYYWFYYILIKKLSIHARETKISLFFLIIVISEFVSHWFNVGYIMITTEIMLLFSYMSLKLKS